MSTSVGSESPPACTLKKRAVSGPVVTPNVCVVKRSAASVSVRDCSGRSQRAGVALGEPSALEPAALRQRPRERVRKAPGRPAGRLRRRRAALRERLPAAARADPPLRGLLGHPFEQLLARAPLLRRLD